MEDSTTRLEEQSGQHGLGSAGVRGVGGGEDPFVPSACVHMVTLMVASSIVIGLLIPPVVVALTLRRTVDEKSPFALQQTMSERNGSTALGYPWRSQKESSALNIICVLRVNEWNVQWSISKYCSHVVLSQEPGAIVDLLEQMIHPPSSLAPPTLTLSALRKHIEYVQLNETLHPRYLLRIENTSDTMEFISQTLLRIEYVASNLLPWLVRNFLDGLYLEDMFHPDGEVESIHSMLDLLRGFHALREKLDLDLMVTLHRKTFMNVHIREMVMPYVTLAVVSLHRNVDTHRTSFLAPLFSDHNTTESIASVVDYFLQHKINASKLALAISLVATSYTLESEQEHTVGSINRAGGELGEPGPLSKIPGRLWYRELCQTLYNINVTRYYDPLAAVPYISVGDQWIAYEDQTSLKNKMRFVSDKKLGGVSIYGVTSDDIEGICGKPFPLLMTVYNTLIEQMPSIETRHFNVT